VLSFSPVVGIGTPPTLHPQASVPLLPFGSGGRGTLAGERGVGRVPIPTRGHTLWYSLYICTLWIWDSAEEDVPRFLYYALGTSDFDAQMYGIKFWKGNENLRPVYKIPIYEIVSAWLLAFWTSKFIESTHWLFYEMKTFFFWIGRMSYKNSVFLYCFKKGTFDISKKCTQKRFIWDSVLPKTFFVCTFYCDKIYIFEISMKRQIFCYHIPLIWRKKVFIS
jgi:hypothetical protein